MLNINLTDSTVVTTLATLLLGDNRALGFLAPSILAAVFGGHVEGGGNKQVVWVDKDGKKHAVGVGEDFKCFVKSSNKGAGRSGLTLKEGECYTRFLYDKENNIVSVQTYSQAEVLVGLGRS